MLPKIKKMKGFFEVIRPAINVVLTGILYCESSNSRLVNFYFTIFTRFH